MSFKGIVTISHQLGGEILGIHETEKTYPEKKDALINAMKLSSYIENRYTVYANMDYSTKELQDE